MINPLAVKVASKAISYLGKKQNPEKMAAFGKKVSHTIKRVKQGAEIAGQIANTVSQVADAAKGFQDGLPAAQAAH